MTDQELLEYAAKAAGLEINKSLTGTLFVLKGVSQWCDWNPLIDDGDALRLAVKMGMEVYIDTHPEGCDCTEVWSVTYDQPKKHERCVSHGDDPCAATRRAIVMCAASIGKEMI
jgi:hypothetical protein